MNAQPNPSGPSVQAPATTTDWLARWRERGLDPIPLCRPIEGGCTLHDGCKHPGKVPYPKRGWTTRRYTDADFSERTNVGLRMGSGHLALDLDAPDVDLSALDLPETLTLRSARGRHLVFRTKRDLRNARCHPKVDVRSKGGQIVVAPSLHASGATYAIEVDHPIAELTEAHVQAIERAQSAQRKGAEARAERPERAADYVVARAHRALDRLRDVPVDGPGHDSIRDVAWHLAHLEREHGSLGFPWRDEVVRIVTQEWSEPCGENDARACITSAVQRAEAEPHPAAGPRLSTDKKGRVRPTLANALAIVRGDERLGGLAWDERGQSLVWREPPPWAEGPEGVWRDSDATRAAEWAAGEYRTDLGSATLHEALKTIAEERAFDPVSEYLDGLAWDGTPRGDGLFTTYFGAEDSPYTRAVARSWLIGAVARARDPGCRFDTVPLLEGEQGIGKSRGVAALGGAWSSDSIAPFGDRMRFFESLHGVWIAELGELAAMRRAEAEQVKSLISSPVDTYRAAYGRDAIRRPRRCVFVGTTNAGAEYLADQTGNRRFMPIRCGRRVDVEGLARDRDQIWAEAAHRHAQGEPTFISDPSVLAAARVEQAARTATDPWEDLIAEHLDGKHVAVLGRILSDVLGVPRERWPAATARVAGILGRLGWRKDAAERGRRAPSGRRVRLYLAPGFDVGNQIPWDEVKIDAAA